MNHVHDVANICSPRRMVLGKLGRIADGVSVCASSAMLNQFKGCLFGVQGVRMVDTWNTLLNGLEVGDSAIMHSRVLPNRLRPPVQLCADGKRLSKDGFIHDHSNNLPEGTADINLVAALSTMPT
jgi:hypothetical protein